MKRSAPLRRTRLAPGKPLRRSTLALDPGQDRPTPARKPLPRRASPLRKVSARRQQQAASRRATEAALTAIRPGCWMCGRQDVEVHGHEILGRAQGGDPTKPDAMLCNPCNEMCEFQPILAAWYGWKTSRKHPVMPCIASGRCLPWQHRSRAQRRWDRAGGAA